MNKQQIKEELTNGSNRIVKDIGNCIRITNKWTFPIVLDGIELVSELEGYENFYAYDKELKIYRLPFILIFPSHQRFSSVRRLKTIVTKHKHIGYRLLDESGKINTVRADILESMLDEIDYKTWGNFPYEYQGHKFVGWLPEFEGYYAFSDDNKILAVPSAYPDSNNKKPYRITPRMVEALLTGKSRKNGGFQYYELYSPSKTKRIQKTVFDEIVLLHKHPELKDENYKNIKFPIKLAGSVWTDYLRGSDHRALINPEGEVLRIRNYQFASTIKCVPKDGEYRVYISSIKSLRYRVDTVAYMAGKRERDNWNDFPYRHLGQIWIGWLPGFEGRYAFSADASLLRIEYLLETCVDGVEYFKYRPTVIVERKDEYTLDNNDGKRRHVLHRSIQKMVKKFMADPKNIDSFKTSASDFL